MATRTPKAQAAPTAWLSTVAADDVNPAVRSYAKQIARLIWGLRRRADSAEARIKELSEPLGRLCSCNTDPNVAWRVQTLCPLHGNPEAFAEDVCRLREMRIRAAHIAQAGSPAVRPLARHIVTGGR